MPCCDRLCMLIWKQWLIEKRNPAKPISEISLPVIISVGILVINTFYITTSQQDAVFRPYKTGIGERQFSNQTELIYCPSNKQLAKLILTTTNMLGITNVKSFRDEEAMQIYVDDEVVQERLFAAIQFNGMTHHDDSLPSRLNVSLRFPEFNVAKGYNTSWMTNFLYPSVADIRYGLRDPDDNVGPFPYYQKKGFLIVQEALSLAFIDAHKQLNTPPNIFMQRQPRPSWKKLEIFGSHKTLNNVVVFMFLSFVFPFIGVIKLVAHEKEVHVKQALETAGVPSWMLWVSYFIRSLILFLFCFIILLLALNLPRGHSLIAFSDNLLILTFFFCFSSASITLAFLVSVLHSSTVQAATLGAILWFISFVPFYQVRREFFGGVIAYMFAPLAFFPGFDIIFAFELTKEGVLWTNLWKYPTPKHRFCFAHMLLSLSGCAIFYLLLTLYIEAGFPCVGTCGKKCALWRKCMRHRVQNENVRYVEDVIQEQPPSNLPLAVKIINLRKVYSKGFTALANLSLDLYENQITVLLGPNGAGKTTTANIIAGIIKPTDGTIKIYKSHVRELLGEDQTYLGYCPQTNILFNELTVEEHIYLFSRIKGYSSVNAIEEADKYISMLHLSDKASTTAYYLTEGLKRRLSIALALCAHSKLVVLDEATAGVDPISKRTIWNMLDAEKKGRSILITTHAMDVAEILGDRIGILSEGVLKCCGSSAYLKKELAGSYRLVIIKRINCKTAKLCRFMQKYISDIKVDSDVGAQLCFMLDKRYASVIEPMLQDLEENQDNLEIQSFRISMPTLEDVFVKTTIGAHTIPFDQVPEISVKFLEGRSLHFNRMFALLLKKVLVYKKSKVLILMHIVFVLVLMIIGELSVYKGQIFDMPPLEISLKSYSQPFMLVYGESIYKKPYIQIVKSANGTIIDTKDVATTIFEHMKKDGLQVLHNYHGGVSFLENDSIIAWYNSFPYHSAPLALHLVLNAIVHQHLSSDYSIEIINHPLSLTKLQKTLRMDASVYDAMQYLLAVFSSMFIIFVIREANTKTMQQQFMCGINPQMYWLMSFFVDIMIYMVIVVLVLIIIVCLPSSSINNLLNLGRLFIILMCYGSASISLCYLIQRWFGTSSAGYAAKILIGVLGIMIGSLLRHLDKIMAVPKWLFCIFYISPAFCLSCALAALKRFQDIEKACVMLFDSCIKYADKENCTNLVSEILQEDRVICDRSYFTMTHYGFLIYLIALLCFAVLFIIANIVLDSTLFASSLHRFYKKKFRQIVDEEEDVMKEREWIRAATTKEIGERTVIIKDVYKTYKRSIALNRMSFTISPYECFGLIGAHGAGKTTILNIVSGSTYAFSGEVLIAGMSLNKNLRKIRTLTAYCPEKEGLFVSLTGEQNLIIYGLIRGVPYKKTRKVAKMIAQKLDFWRHLHKEVKHYSGGNKRKLSVAIALLGNAKIIFLDVPALGMDVGTLKHLWAAIYNERENGRTILLSSHCMEECEAVCSRVGMLVKGKMVCIGTIERLANKFAKGCILTIRCKRLKVNEDETEEQQERLMKFIKEKLPTAVLIESFKEVYTFQIERQPSLSWTKVFSIIDKNKTFLGIEGFTLAQSSLEQVFLSVS